MTHPAYKLVVFDFDGTLADSFPFFLEMFDTLADAHRFRRLERERLDEMRTWDVRRMLDHVGLPVWKAPRVAVHFRKLMAGSIGRIPLFAGAGETLDALSAAGVRLAIVSSNGRDNVQAVLGPERSRLVERYECGVALLGKRPRLRRIVKACGVAPREVLCVGDEARDIEAAHAEGMASGAVAWGYALPAALAARRPTVVFERFEDIVRHVLAAPPVLAPEAALPAQT